MKRIILFALILILSPVGSQLCAQTSNSDWKEVDGKNYSISFPANWEVNKMGDTGVGLVAMAPLDDDNDGFRENFTLVIDDNIEQGVDIKAYAISSSSQVLNSLEEGHVLISESKTSKSGPYYHLVYTGKQGELTLRYAQYFYTKDNTAYVFTLAGDYANHKKYESDFDKIAAAFTLK